MKSPFPGMDPFLEPHWLDVQTALVVEARRCLNGSLPPGIVARAEERVAVESDATGEATRTPFKLVVEWDPIIERSIRILDDDGELIAVVEFLSPTNKRQPGLDRYREKRDGLLSASVHVVEVDLVRSGDWRSQMRPQICPPEAVSTYRAVVRTAGVKPAAYLYPFSLRRPLTDVRVPLRPADPPVSLPLQSMIEDVYADGRYGSTIGYERPLDPPLDPEDAQWVDHLLQSARLR